jgi:myo-inositol 2-dehydrogenase/D-chiro-inositol 1-dehydrogenase
MSLPQGDLRIAVLGVGLIGGQHVERVTNLISNARVTVVNDYSVDRAHEIAATVPGARVVTDPFEAINAADVDALIVATPGPVHEEQLFAALAAGKPVLCEKPLTTDVHTALEVVRREAALGKKLIQVGFMRRFDNEYAALKRMLAAGDLGQPLMMHCVHRNPVVPHGFDSAMIVRDSLVHEVDVARFIFDEEIAAISICKPTPNALAPAGLQDPQVALMETASGRLVTAEVFVTTGVAYEVRTEVVGERGSAMIGLDNGGPITKRGVAGVGAWGGAITPSFRERFGQAFVNEVQSWVDAVRRGYADGSGVFVDGPDAWDGYAAVAVCEAGVRALESGQRVAVEMAGRLETEVAARSSMSGQGAGL